MGSEMCIRDSSTDLRKCLNSSACYRESQVVVLEKWLEARVVVSVSVSDIG